MKVVVLGNQASFPKAGHHHTSLLVSDNNTNVLFDIGPGTNSQFQKYISFTKLDAIFITHMHMDHVLDLPTLTFAVYMYNSLRGGNIKIPVYVPPGGMSFINKLLEVLDAIEYKTSIKIIELNEEVYVGSMKVSFSEMNHNVPTYGYRVDSKEGKSITYSGDTAYTQNLIRLAENSDALFTEATLFHKDVSPRIKHLSAFQAGEIAKLARVKKLFLVHLWHEYDENKLLEEAKRAFPHAEIAKEGEIITI